METNPFDYAECRTGESLQLHSKYIDVANRFGYDQPQAKMYEALAKVACSLCTIQDECYQYAINEADLGVEQVLAGLNSHELQAIKDTRTINL